MPEGFSLINLGEISKPATELVRVISEAVGGAFRPYQIRRVAEAEAEASIISAQANIQITDLHRRAAQRFLTEEAQKQQNIEDITRKALPQVTDNAKPEGMEKDWITNFFDKSRLISDQQMQELWARLLAGEANQPGCYSKRTVDLLASMDKSEAELFKTLCTFVWDIGALTPLIFDFQAPIYNDAGINFNSMQHLELAGLIKFEGLAGFSRAGVGQEIIIGYYGQPFRLRLPLPENNTIPVGKALLTSPGIQLATVSGSSPDSAFRDFVVERWKIYDISSA